MLSLSPRTRRRKIGDGPRISIDGTRAFFHENIIECHRNGEYADSGREPPRKKLGRSLIRFARNRKHFITLFLFSASYIALNVHFIKHRDGDDGDSMNTLIRTNSRKGALQMAGDFTAPSFFDKAVDSCKAAHDALGEYPTAYTSLTEKRRLRWLDQMKSGYVNSVNLINDKLGGYLYATKLGVRTPRILFCGVAKDLPRDMTSFGQKYVVKPLVGHSARGVKVVRDGVNIFKHEKVSYGALIKQYGPERETIVEEIIESAHPKFKSFIPPDFKFQVYEGRPEILFFIDRNKGRECKDFFHVSSKNWKHQEGWTHLDYPNCHPDKYLEPSRQTAMMDAVRVLANSVGENWIRIDMYDSKEGPVLGEFTPYSTNGKAVPLVDCVMSYLFTAHAGHGGMIDDAATVDGSEPLKTFKNKLKMEIEFPTEHPKPIHDGGFGTFPIEADEWKQYGEVEKCNKVMEAQHELDQKRAADLCRSTWWCVSSIFFWWRSFTE